MRNWEQAVEAILFSTQEIEKIERSKKTITNSKLSDQDKTDRIDEKERELKRWFDQRIEVLEDLVRYPPSYLEYEPRMKKLQELIAKNNLLSISSKGSVFIMTKYPDGKDGANDAELKLVIDTVKEAVKACSYYPLLAGEMQLHPNVWENIECHMLACSHGIAIVENRFKPELNPNVAMEWGWMRAMRRPVLYLVEKNVEVTPVDVTGLIKDRFDWLNPQADIPTLVAKYFRLA